MRVLALSSSSAEQSVAVWVDGALRARIVQPFVRRQPRRILRDLSAALVESGLTWDDLDRLAADVGPGSFTGIRAGLATMRALAFSHQLPCVGMTSLAIMAAAVPQEGRERWFALPSRRTTLFFARQDAAGHIHPPQELALVDVYRVLHPECTVFSQESLRPALLAAWPDARDVRSHGGPDAAALAQAAAGSSTVTTAWAALVPKYVAATDAERNTGVYVQARAIPAMERGAMERGTSPYECTRNE